MARQIDPERDAMLDKRNLDEEARRLPSLMQMYQSEINECVSQLNDLRFELEKLEAKAKVDVRKAIIDRGEKPSIDSVNAEVSCMDSIMALRKKRDDLERSMAYMKGMLSVLDCKRSCLGNLVSLYLKEYYSDKDVESGIYKEADARRCGKDSDAQQKMLGKAIRRHDLDEDTDI